MTQLPPALSSWGPELEGLPADLACVLEPWLLRLSSALGPLASRHAVGDGPPDGFDGLTRRGRYERLLPSEWILAELYPEEFLRRATNSEHLFYALAHQAPASNQRTVILFDAGPDQLGAPRLLHLAFLLTMARRSRAAKVELSWGVLQADTPRLLETVSPQSVLTLMKSRSPELPSRDGLNAYLDLLPGPSVNDDDVWLVGGRYIEAIAAPKMRQARIREPLSLTERRVTLQLGDASAQLLQFELPSEPDAIRLIRNPFAVGPRAIANAQVLDARPSKMLFSEDGRSLFVRAPDGLWTYPQPRQNGHQAATQCLDERQGQVIAAGRVGRGHYLIVNEDGRPAIEQYTRHGNHPERLYLDKAQGWGCEWPADRISPCVMQGGKRSKAVLILDCLGRVLRIQVVGTRTLETFCDGVAGLGRALGGTVMVLNADAYESPAPEFLPPPSVPGNSISQSALPKRAIVLLDGGGQIQRVVHLEAGDGDYRTLFSASWVAVRIGFDRWFLLGRDTDAEVQVPEGHTVIGVNWQDEPGLIVVGPDHRSLYLRTPKESEALGTTSLETTSIVCSPREAVVAFARPDGGLRVEDYRQGQPRLDFSGNDS